MNDINQLSPEERYKTRMKRYKNLIAAMEKTVISKETMEEIYNLFKADESWFSDSGLTLTIEELYLIATQFHEELANKKHSTPNDIRGLMNFLNRR